MIRRLNSGTIIFEKVKSLRKARSRVGELARSKAKARRNWISGKARREKKRKFRSSCIKQSARISSLDLINSSALLSRDEEGEKEQGGAGGRAAWRGAEKKLGNPIGRFSLGHRRFARHRSLARIELIRAISGARGCIVEFGAGARPESRGSLALLRAGGCGGGRQLGQYPPDARWPTPTPTRTQSYIHLCTQMYNPAPLGRERAAPFSPSASDFDPPSLPASTSEPSTRYMLATSCYLLRHPLSASRTPNFIIIICPTERSVREPLPPFLPSLREFFLI